MEDERRRNGGLSERQFEALKARLRVELKEELAEELYEDLWNSVSLRVGKTVLSKGLYLFGTVILALAAWLHGAGWLKFPGAAE